MKTIDEIIKNHGDAYEYKHDLRVVPLEDCISYMAQYATQQVKAFQNDLKQFIQANPKATVKQILEHFNI